MSTTGTTSYVPVFDDLLLEAWERLGLSPTILSGDVARSARRSLQLMLLDWSNQDIQLWQLDRLTLPATIGQGVMLGPPGTIDVMEMWVTAQGIDMMLAPMGRDEWAGIPNKATPGRPTQFWCERRRDAVVLHVWPVPDQAYPLTVNRFRLPQDVGGLSMSPDVPVLWSEAVASGLAARLALKYAPARYAMLKADAAEGFARANGEDRERVALRIEPDMRGYR